jgi:FAD/FMN-containing dehydrogenase
MSAAHRQRFLDELVTRLGRAAVIRDPAGIEGFLGDNSWLSPILSQHIEQMKGGSGGHLRVDAVVSPANVTELRDVIALAVRHGVPMTLRGGGTSNFGQTIPLEGGIIVDTLRLNRVLAIAEASVTAEGGALHGDVENAVRARGRELTLLTTTYASATVAGWVGGGHVGIGSSMYGTIWDGNVLKAKLLTAEDPPRELVLEGDDLCPVLHTYGTTGAMTEVTFPLVPAKDWIEAVAVFDSFRAAARFTKELAEDPGIPQRVVAAQEPPIPLGFTPLKHLFREGQSAVLFVIDAPLETACRGLAERHGGTYHFWKRSDDPRRVPLAYMVYGHRMLWLKKLAPQAAFLHSYCDPETVFDQFRALKERFGSDLWLELKYMRSRWLRALRGLPGDGLLPAPTLTLVPGTKAFIEAVMAFCDAIGVTYQNPHTFVLEESGIFGPNFGRIVEFKRRTDPKGLLNPGKIGKTFFAKPGAGRA